MCINSCKCEHVLNQMFADLQTVARWFQKKLNVTFWASEWELFKA